MCRGGKKTSVSHAQINNANEKKKAGEKGRVIYAAIACAAFCCGNNHQKLTSISVGINFTPPFHFLKAICLKKDEDAP